MWHDYYLKFDDENDFLAVMSAELQAEAGPWHATDVVGTLYRDDTGAPCAGFHVNLRLPDDTPLPDALADKVIAAPKHPKRVFA